MTWPPDADVVVLSSRVSPVKDAGYAVAVLTRLRLLKSAGVPRPLLLSLDAAAADERARADREMRERGLLDDEDRVINLFGETTATSEWLRDASEPGEASPGIDHRLVLDDDGTPLLSLPVIPGDPDWHLTGANIVVHHEEGDRVIAGFGALYLGWLSHVAHGLREKAGSENRMLVVICESRQIGELLTGWDDPRVRLVHTVHNSHLAAPHLATSPLRDRMWTRWMAQIDRFDTILWPTASQLHDVRERFGDHPGFAVAPTPIQDSHLSPSRSEDGASTVVMANRLVPQKRVDLAIRAWPAVRAAIPEARLHIYGEGVLRGELSRLIGQLEVADSVQLHGHTNDLPRVLRGSTLFLSTSAFEGQNLALGEALSAGLPVISTDVRYGPRDIVGSGGILIPPNDVGAISEALLSVLTSPTLRHRLSEGALVAARALSPHELRAGFASILRHTLERPPRRSERTRIPG